MTHSLHRWQFILQSHQQIARDLSQQVIALTEVVERSKDSGKHKEAEREAKAQEDSDNKVLYCSSYIHTYMHTRAVVLYLVRAQATR